MVENKKLRACFVCTHSLTLATLYKGLFPYLRSRGWDISVIVGDREYTEFNVEDFGVIDPIIIPMKRLPSPIDDLVSLFRFYSHFKNNIYDVVHISTPKASLLASIARRLAGQPGVVFVYRRCVYEMMSGLKRQVYLFTDRVTAFFSDRVVPISRQLFDFLGEQNVVSRLKLVLFGAGSSNGVDVDRFSPSEAKSKQAQELARSMGFNTDAPILLFVGRICREKGVDLIPPLMDRIRKVHPDVQLLVAGPDDARDPIDVETVRWLEGDKGTRRLGFVADPAALFALSTVFVFPSYFEGFGNVLLEAAASGKASVAFKAPGVQEAVEHGVSGLLAPIGDVEVMGNHVIELLSDTAFRERMESQALERVNRLFRREAIWDQMDRLMRSVVR